AVVANEEVFHRYLGWRRKWQGGDPPLQVRDLALTPAIAGLVHELAGLRQVLTGGRGLVPLEADAGPLAIGGPLEGTHRAALGDLQSFGEIGGGGGQVELAAVKGRAGK